MMLTEGLCRVGRICRGPGVADWRRVAAVLGEVAAEERSGLLGSTDRRAVRLRRDCEAQGGWSTKGTERIRRRPYSPAMECGVTSGRRRGLGRGRRARGASWDSGGASARLRGGSAVRSVVATRSRGAAQGGAAQARQARVTAAVAERDGRRGGPQGLFVRRRGDLGVRARGWKAGEISGEYRGRALREEGEETGVWGHGVSGSGRLRVLRSQAPTGGPGGAVRVALAGERGRVVRVERERAAGAGACWAARC